MNFDVSIILLTCADTDSHFKRVEAASTLTTVSFQYNKKNKTKATDDFDVMRICAPVKELVLLAIADAIDDAIDDAEYAMISRVSSSSSSSSGTHDEDSNSEDDGDAPLPAVPDSYEKVYNIHNVLCVGDRTFLKTQPYTFILLLQIISSATLSIKAECFTHSLGGASHSWSPAPNVSNKKGGYMIYANS